MVIAAQYLLSCLVATDTHHIKGGVKAVSVDEIRWTADRLLLFHDVIYAAHVSFASLIRGLGIKGYYGMRNFVRRPP